MREKYDERNEKMAIQAENMRKLKEKYLKDRKKMLKGYKISKEDRNESLYWDRVC